MTKLTFLQIFRLLHRHRKLADRRDPMYDANKAAKWMVGIFGSLMLVYILMFAVIIALAANDSRRFTSLEVITGVLPFVLLIDFWVRFIAQQTPAQLVRPYLLLPIPKYHCIDGFILTSLFGWGNTTWFVLLVPFCLMSVVFTAGIGASLSLILFWYIIILANSQGYAIVRTLTMKHVLWWLLPAAVSVLIVSPLLIKDITFMFKVYAVIGEAIGNGSMLPHLVALLILGVTVAVNRRLQYNGVMEELGRQNVSAPKTIIKYSFLERLGELGEYLKLEMKMVTRNKNPRKAFITGVVAIVAISALISLTDIYDTSLMTNFWCIYNYVIFAAMLLVKVMCYEGNFIDVLMVHKENILRLLTAKYYFFCILLLLPFTLMLPMVFVGKWSVLMLLSYGIFTAGFQHFWLMQLAVYNKKSIPLNEKLIGKGGMENNYIQVLEEMGAFFLPLIVIQILEAVFNQQVAWLTMMGIGIVFVAGHKLWLRNIYHRMMKRRYKNMESFHT